MTPQREARRASRAQAWVNVVVCGLPLFILLLAVALGINISTGLYWSAVLWGLGMILWLACYEFRERRTPEGLRSDVVLEDTEALREEAAAIAANIPHDVLDVRGWQVNSSGIALRGTFGTDPQGVQATVASAVERLSGRRPLTLVQEDVAGEPYVLVTNTKFEQNVATAIPRRRPTLSSALFLATLATTTLAGAMHAGVDLGADAWAWTAGLPYGIGVMLILGVHEMGHYVAARLHGVRVSLPYFIPVPFALGTFGAFISMPALLKDRRQLFDIGVAGPLAGLMVAVPALALGLQWSEALPSAPASSGHMSMLHGVSVNSSLLLALVAKLSIGAQIAEGHFLVLHPLAFAGWLGLMLTALNLVPVGQLDGGHIANSLFGLAQASRLAGVALFTIVVLGVFVWSGFLLWALIVFFVAGRTGIPPVDALTPLDGRRRLLGWVSFAILASILVPLPHALFGAVGLHCPYL